MGNSEITDILSSDWFLVGNLRDILDINSTINLIRTIKMNREKCRHFTIAFAINRYGLLGTLERAYRYGRRDLVHEIFETKGIITKDYNEFEWSEMISRMLIDMNDFGMSEYVSKLIEIFNSSMPQYLQRCLSVM